MNILLFGHIDIEYTKILVEQGHNVTISTQEICLSNNLPKNVHVLVNDDPGGMPETNNKNINRHIKNVYDGIKHLDENDRVFVMRGDCKFGIENIEEHLEHRLTNSVWKTDEYSIFKEKIVIPNLYTCNPIQGLKLLFHPGDWFRYGLVSDLRFLYDIPYQEEKNLFAENGFLRYRSEQYVFIKSLQKKYNLDIQYDVDTGFELIQQSIRAMLNNFTVADIDKIKLTNSKYHPPPHVGPPAFVNELYYSQLLDNYRHVHNES